MNDEALHRLAAEFFYVFARMEYALKASGFHYGDGPAEPNWTDFAKSVETIITNPSTSELKDAIEFILSAPPKKQFIAGGAIEWREIQPSTNSKADALFQYVRRIRNNLFHGGKFNGHWFAPERSESLMKAALVVLRQSIEAQPQVSEAFHG